MRSGYGGEEMLFMPDTHPWYLSLEHALEVERDRVTVLTRPTEEGETVDDSVHVLVRASFASTYVWPVFRHLTHLGL